MIGADEKIVVATRVPKLCSVYCIAVPEDDLEVTSIRLKRQHARSASSWKLLFILMYRHSSGRVVARQSSRLPNHLVSEWNVWWQENANWILYVYAKTWWTKLELLSRSVAWNAQKRSFLELFSVHLRKTPECTYNGLKEGLLRDLRAWCLRRTHQLTSLLRGI